MKDPTVTVVVPVYRRLRFLQEALPSALRQTYRDFELIVTDDSASDEIAGYVASLNDSRVRYRRNESNLGTAMNHLAAFAEARGRFIASLHDDDLWEPDFLATLVPPLLADNAVSVAFCDHHMIDEKGGLLAELTEANTRLFRRNLLSPGRHQPFLKEAVIDQSIPMAMAAVFQKSVVEGADYPQRIGGCYDYWLAYLATRAGQAVYYEPRRLTSYRDHDESGTSLRRLFNLREAVYVRNRFRHDSQLAAYARRMDDDLGQLYGKMALHYLPRRSPWRGKVLLKQARSLLSSPRRKLALAVHLLRNRVRNWFS